LLSPLIRTTAELKLCFLLQVVVELTDLCVCVCLCVCSVCLWCVCVHVCACMCACVCACVYSRTCMYVRTRAWRRASCTHLEGRGQWCGVGSSLPPSHGFWGLNSGLEAHTASPFTPLTITLIHTICFRHARSFNKYIWNISFMSNFVVIHTKPKGILI